MKRDFIKDFFTTLPTEGQMVTLGGWVRTVRDSKTFGFIEINDGSCFKNVQIVFNADIIENFDTVAKLPVGAAIVVKGKIILTPQNKQAFEVVAENVTLEGDCDPDYPIQKKRHSLEFLREKAYLRPRTNTFNAVFKIRSEIAYAVHKFFNDKNFVYVHTPIITASDCEGAGAMFQVTTLDMNKPPKDADGNVDYSNDFFNKKANLTVSGQLNGETYAMAFGNIYTFGPTFRAERSNTARHAAEFWMIEPEIAFADLTDYMDLAEDMVKFIINYIIEKCPQEMEFLNTFVDKELVNRLNNVVGNEFKRLTYTEAIEILKSSNVKFEFPVDWGLDLQSEHERYLTEKVFNKPVFLTDYPKEIKSFYMRMNDDNKTVACADLLVPGIGELIGGSQREERLDMLKSRMKELDLREEDYWWYLDLRRFGGTKHAGYGMGFERMVMYVTGIGNIRDVLPYPRTVNNAEY